MKQSYSHSDILANIDHGLANLLYVYGLATHSLIERGLAWYRDAYNEAVAVADKYDLPVTDVIIVAAILSPQVKWEDNIYFAELAIRYFLAGGYVPDIRMYKAYGGELNLQGYSIDHDDWSEVCICNDACFEGYCSAYRSNQIKALWYLQGSHDVASGPKVSRFLDNILNYKTSKHVTVDSHAIQAWFGKLEAGTYGIPDNCYKLIEADYVEAASRVGCSPLEFQAIVWLTKKEFQTSKRQPVSLSLYPPCHVQRRQAK